MGYLPVLLSMCPAGLYSAHVFLSQIDIMTALERRPKKVKWKKKIRVTLRRSLQRRF